MEPFEAGELVDQPDRLLSGARKLILLLRLFMSCLLFLIGAAMFAVLATSKDATIKGLILPAGLTVMGGTASLILGNALRHRETRYGTAGFVLGVALVGGSFLL